MNLRPPGYEPDELPDCSTPRRCVCVLDADASYFRCLMAPRVGLEPTTYRLTAECSTIELPRITFGDDLLSRGVTTRVPSALRGFTSVFGMGTGVSLSLSSPYFQSISHSKEYSRSSLRPISIPQLHVLLHFHMEPINHIFFMGSSKKSHLEGGFVLRCLQHLSLPDVALEPCIWRYNSSTSGPSIPVLSY